MFQDRPMRNCAIALLFAALPAAAAGSPQDGDDLFDAKTELTRSLNQLQKAESYTFETTWKSESAQGSGWRPSRSRPSTETKGKYHATDGIVGKTGDTKLARKDDKVAFTDGRGKWQVSGSSGRNVGERSRRDRGGDAERLRARYSMLSRGTQYASFDGPHRRLAEILEGIDSIDLADETETVDKHECVVFHAVLTKEGAESLAGSGGSSWARGTSWGGRGRGGGGSERQTKYAGTATFWVDDSWTLRKVETSVVRKIAWGDQEYGTRNTETTEFSAFGETTVELPRKAETALKEATEEQAESRGNED